MGTKNNPGAFDCYANAEPDEPMFVLLGRDRHAPALVWLWALLRQADGERPDKVAEARKCAEDMTSWNAARGRPVIGLSHFVLAGLRDLQVRIADLEALNRGLSDRVAAQSELLTRRAAKEAADGTP